MHIHVGALEFFKIGLYVIIFGFFWRILTGLTHETAVGKAMAFIY